MSAVMQDRRAAVDFHKVEKAHYPIHSRLENWAQWANNRPQSIVQPMFMLYRPDGFDRVLNGSVVDQMDAQRIQKEVAALPEGHRLAITWCYVAPCSPTRMARTLGETLQGLADLVRTGRQMLINRRA